MFEQLRQSLRDAMSRATSPAESHAVIAMMKDALVEARLGLTQLREALALSERQLEHERGELATAERRGKMARDIGDVETTSVAERFAVKYRERITVLERKREAQVAELSLVEREVAEMTTQLKDAAANPAGMKSSPPSAPDLGEPLGESDSLRRDIDRSARESAAERQLEELKKRMGR